MNGGHNISMGYQSAKGLNGGSNAVIGFQAGMGVEGSNNIILGTNATSKSIIPGNLKVQNVVSLGTNSKATTDNSVSIGAYSEAKGRAAIAIGQNSNASKDNSMAIGNRTSVNAVKDVAIGSDSSTSATTGVSKATITVPGTGKSITYGTFAGSNPDAAFSVGSAGRERQIQNVAAGRISSTSTDAINGSQLYAVANELGKTWKANAGGNLSGSTTSTQVMTGDEVQFVAGKNLEVKQDLATGSQKYTYSLKKDVDLGSTGSLKAGPVTINNNGIDAGSKKITNVAPGTADTDAANVSQVKAAKTEVKSPDSSINVTTDNTSPDGHTIYNVTIDKSGKVATGDTKLVTGDTVNTAINNAKTDLINNNPLKFGGDSGTAVTRKLGEQLDIKGGATGATTSGNIAVIADRNNTLNIQLAKNLTGLDSITTNGGNTVINNNGITTPKVTINNAGWNVVAVNTGTGTTSGSVSNNLITPGEIVKLQAGDNLNVDQSGGTFTYT